MGREGSILLVLAVAALSCAQTSAPGRAQAQPPAASPAPPAFELRTVEHKEGDCAAEATPCAHFLARFPVVTGGVPAPIREILNGAIVSLVARADGFITAGEDAEEGGEAGDERAPATVEEAATEFFSGWSQNRAELPADAPAAYSRWADERRMEVIHADARVLSVELTLYAFTGGAHPNTFVELRSFDLATGEPLALADLVVAGAAPRLEALGERLFRREWEIPDDESLEEAGFWFDDDRFALTDNFAVTGKGLVFVYNPYEVAPYVFGPTRITLPWSELRGLLRPEAPAAPAAGPVRKSAATS